VPAIPSAPATITWSFTDVFNASPVDPGWIVGINDAIEFLTDNGLTSTAPSIARIANILSGASATLTYFVGDIAPTTYDEWYDGGSSRIALIHEPVTSVVSVTETFGSGGNNHVLTAQTQDGVGPFDSYGYTVDLVSGILYRRAAGVAVSFWAGARNVHVVYKTGNQTAAADLVLACLEMVRYYWSQSQGAGGAYSAVPITDYASLPNIVQNKIGRWRVQPGIA